MSIDGVRYNQGREQMLQAVRQVRWPVVRLTMTVILGLVHLIKGLLRLHMRGLVGATPAESGWRLCSGWQSTPLILRQSLSSRSRIVHDMQWPSPVLSTRAHRCDRRNFVVFAIQCMARFDHCTLLEEALPNARRSGRGCRSNSAPSLINFSTYSSAPC